MMYVCASSSCTIIGKHQAVLTSINCRKGKKIKRYLLSSFYSFTEQVLWSRWSEEWVVLYDDSTMAWFTEPGRSSPAGKILVKEAPEMLAIAHWTGQIPRRPPLPDGVSVSQLIALGSRRKRSKVYWMIAKSEEELPPPPQIELVVDKPHLMGVLRRPIVRIRRELRLIGSPDTIACSEVSARRKNRHTIEHNTTKVKGEAAVAIIKKNAQDTTDPKGSLACALPWGHGWGWATLPNGIWSGALTWSQCEDSITLHALPTTHCTNMIETPCAGGIYHTDIGPFDFHGIEDVGGEDFDYAMDCGDFIF
ncbi:AGAP013121-PB [Anopheles gambiae str. PEST]|uniref:AGAP013121-PA n=1 Tax=Anopheles gambiae TaxID=7165 RepID=F5HJ56_ANOGA|nr:AGAP013121-PA [Anopheles gambiae str. PEST]EGK96318.1 AGAP013121-PB [Anopheles gambiae str. PEST]